MDKQIAVWLKEIEMSKTEINRKLCQIKRALKKLDKMELKTKKQKADARKILVKLNMYQGLWEGLRRIGE